MALVRSSLLLGHPYEHYLLNRSMVVCLLHAQQNQYPSACMKDHLHQCTQEAKGVIMWRRTAGGIPIKSLNDGLATINDDLSCFCFFTLISNGSGGGQPKWIYVSCPRCVVCLVHHNVSTIKYVFQLVVLHAKQQKQTMFSLVLYWYVFNFLPLTLYSYFNCYLFGVFYSRFVADLVTLIQIPCKFSNGHEML